MSNLINMPVSVSHASDRIKTNNHYKLSNCKWSTPKEQAENRSNNRMYILNGVSKTQSQWARELGVVYECPVFATSQISVDGDTLLYPIESMLKDSKTGKQGACDGIIMLGCANNPLVPLERGLSMPKEKCKRPGQDHMREPIIFDQDRARFGVSNG